MTPRELWVYARAYRNRVRSEARAKRSEIYALASLIRPMIWAKHPPRFERVFPEDVRRKEMNDEQMMQQVLALNAAFGGRVTEVRNGSS